MSRELKESVKMMFHQIVPIKRNRKIIEVLKLKGAKITWTIHCRGSTTDVN